MSKYFKVDGNLFEVADPPPVDPTEPAEVFEWPTVGEITQTDFQKGLGVESPNTGGSTTQVAALPLTMPKAVGVTVGSGSIKKTLNTTLWDAGGWGDKPGSIFLWQANVITAVAIMGWVPMSAVGVVDWKKFAHGLYIANNAVTIYEFGAEKAKSTFLQGDILTASLVGSAVVYAVNSKLLFTSTKHALEPLVPGVMVRSYNIEVSNLKFA